MAKKKPSEYIKSNLKKKTVYHYKDTEEGLDLLSKEIFKDKDVEIHYPFNTRNGKPKYDTIKAISFNGFSGKIPAGFLKAFTRGYGFTRDLSPLVYEIQKLFPKISKISIIKKGKSSFPSTSEIIFSELDLSLARPKIKALNAKQKDEKEKLAKEILSKMYPGKIAHHTSTYPKGELFRIIDTYQVSGKKLSNEDIQAVQNLFKSISSMDTLSVDESFINTKESIDKAVTEKLISDYEKLLNRKQETKNLESSWQSFFRDNLLYLNFGYVNRFEKEKVLGDKSINIPDFLMLNSFSFLDVFEIKTHLTSLLSYDSGRKNFYWTSEACKAISQAENYIDSLIKQENEIIKNIRDEYGGISVNAVRPFVYIIASSKPQLAGSKTSSYKGKEKAKLENDFRRLNNSLKNIKIILYDELLENFKHFIERLSPQQDI